MISAPPKSAPLNHIKVTQSLQGVTVPLVFGTARIAGKLIYDADLVAHPESTSGKAKGGKSGLYAYTGTFLAALCEGPILGVLGIWDQQGLLPLTTAQVALGTIPSPVGTAIILSTGAGGALPARTYFARATYVYANGESGYSAEQSQAFAANQLCTVISPAAQAGATGWNVYMSESAGTETLQNASPIAIGTNWTEPTGGLINTGASAPGQPVVTVPPPGPTGGGAGDSGGNNWGSDSGVQGPTGPFQKSPPDTF